MDDAMCDAELENEEGEDFAPPGHMAQMQESFVQIAANVRNSLNIQVFNQCYFLQFIHKLFDKPSSCSTLRLFQLASASPSLLSPHVGHLNILCHSNLTVLSKRSLERE